MNAVGKVLFPSAGLLFILFLMACEGTQSVKVSVSVRIMYPLKVWYQDKQRVPRPRVPWVPSTRYAPY
jgi:hypothetical protein